MKVGEVYNNNLVVVRKLGWGHFSTVWCAWDRKKKKQVALKVQKSASHYTEAAMDEIDFLNKAASIDHPGSRQVHPSPSPLPPLTSFNPIVFFHPDAENSTGLHWPGASGESFPVSGLGIC